MRQLLILLTVTTLFLSACDQDDSAGRTDPTSSSTSTVVATTADPWSGVVEVTFDGEGCSVSGPKSIPAGTAQAFVVTDDSEDGVWLDLYVSSLLGGKTIDDMVEGQDAVGGVPNYYPKPDWVQYESRSFDPAHLPAIDLADNQTLEVFLLTYGDDVVYLGAENPTRIWFCDPLKVTAIEF